MEILSAMLEAAAPEAMIRNHVARSGEMLKISGREIHLGRFRHVHCLGVGKGAARLFAALHPLLSDRLQGGVIIGPEKSSREKSPVTFLRGDHPIPGRRSLRSTRLLIHYIHNQIREKDLVIFLLTGGASALTAAPLPGIPIRDLQRLNQVLMSSHASIGEINAIRATFSRVKGGGLARLIHPASLWTLAVSDVIGSSPGIIGSAPTIQSGPLDAAGLEEILYRNGIPHAAIPRSIWNTMDHPCNRDEIEFPPEVYTLIGDNTTALEAGCRTAADLGYTSGILTRRLQGPVEPAARRLARIIRRHVDRSRAWVFGGEITVQVRGKGKGGRNQELVLHLARELQNLDRPFFFASMGSDGIDGPTSAAGAWITKASARRLASHEVALSRALKKNDSYRFFRRFGNHIRTGPTGTNIMDLGVILLPNLSSK